MFIAAIISVFVLCAWTITYVRATIFNEGDKGLYDVMTVLPAACITFLCVYFNAI